MRISLLLMLATSIAIVAGQVAAQDGADDLEDASALEAPAQDLLPDEASDEPVPEQAATQEQSPAEDEEDEMRFRWAFHAAGGPWRLPAGGGGFGGVGIQLGVQLNELIGIYYAGMAGVGAGVSVEGRSASAGAMVQNALMVDATLLNLIQVGAGPSLDYMGLAFGSANETGASAGAAAGAFFGLNARAGLALSRKKPGARGRLMVGLEIHPTFVASGIVPTTVLITLGGGRF